MVAHRQEKTMLFTDRMQAQLQDLQNEIPLFIPDEDHQQDFQRIILNQVRLFRSNSPWGDWTFSFENNFRDSWIMTVVESIMECGMNDVECANRWLMEQNEAETFDHPLKTVVRMAEIRAVSALARGLFTSTVTLPWVHPRIKAFWYALAQSPSEDALLDCEMCGNPECEQREIVFAAQTHLTVGGRYVNLSLFDCAVSPYGA